MNGTTWEEMREALERSQSMYAEQRARTDEARDRAARHEATIAELRAELAELKSASVPVLETPPPPRQIKAREEIARQRIECHGCRQGDNRRSGLCSMHKNMMRGVELCESKSWMGAGGVSPVEPVPTLTSELRERIGRLWMEAGWAVTALESGQTPDDPLATARRYQGDMNALRTMIDNATVESAPVPAPRLEWEIDDDEVAATAGGVWEIYQPLRLRPDIWALHRHGAEIERRESWSKDAAKSLAEKLNDVLSPPVGPQEKPWLTNCTYHGTCPQPDACDVGCRGPQGASVSPPVGKSE